MNTTTRSNFLWLPLMKVVAIRATNGDEEMETESDCLLLVAAGRTNQNFEYLSSGRGSSTTKHYYF